MKQLTTRFRSHLRHNLIAYLALFFALGGTAIAAKPLITGADVQDGSLTGADVSDDSTLKGVDIDESDLGKVPSAANADFASDADTIDGRDLGDVARFGGLIGSDGSVLAGTGDFTVERQGLGFYEIRFPSGTFTGSNNSGGLCRTPIATATTDDFGPIAVTAHIRIDPVQRFPGSFGDPSCSEDGSAKLHVTLLRSDSGEAVDQHFFFIAM